MPQIEEARAIVMEEIEPPVIERKNNSKESIREKGIKRCRITVDSRPALKNDLIPSLC
ncbi:MAG: hypothetical protein N2257_04060 [Thermodesulfovibrionales bacterium]|nr:hypothetical protein [Thermodesulfovibrionales bacterium]